MTSLQIKVEEIPRIGEKTRLLDDLEWNTVNLVYSYQDHALGDNYTDLITTVHQKLSLKPDCRSKPNHYNQVSL